MRLFNVDVLWLAVGLFGQAMFSARFLVQWIASELQRRSVIPLLFWYFSLGGGVTLLVYAIHREDPVFILGQGAGLFIYARNLWLIRAARRRTAAEGAQPGE